METLHEKSGFERDLLVALAGLGEPNGRQLRDEVEQVVDRDIQTGQVYDRLGDFADEGLVEKEAVDARENIYRLTPEGRRLVQEYGEWVWSRVPE